MADLEKQVLTVVKVVEEKLDDEIAALSRLDLDDIEVLRECRLQQINKMAEKRNRWISLGHGNYSKIPFEKDFFSVVKASDRVVYEKVMSGLKSEYGGPDFEPHVTVVGAISLTEADAVKRFRSAVDGLKAYPVPVERVSTRTFYYQCVFLLLKPSLEVVEPSKVCCDHFGYKNSIGE